MKRFVNGVETDLASSEATALGLHDRLVVRSGDGSSTAVAIRQGDSMLVSFRGRQYRIEKSAARTRSKHGGETGEIFAPMPGMIADVLVKTGDRVADGQKLVVLEAMKTQQAFVSPFSGTVRNVSASAGDQVQEGQLLVRIEPDPGI